MAETRRTSSDASARAASSGAAAGAPDPFAILNPGTFWSKMSELQSELASPFWAGGAMAGARNMDAPPNGAAGQRPPEPASAQDAWIANLGAAQRETASFVNARLSKLVDFLDEASKCKTPQEFLGSCTRWATESADDYAGMLRRLTELTKFAPK